MEVTNYLTMKCTSFDTEPLAFWQLYSRRFPMLRKLTELYLSMSSASVPIESMLPTTDLILNSKWRCWHQTSSIEFHSFMTIMHTYLILNGQKTMNMNDFWIFQWHFHWFHQCGIDGLTLTLICSACNVYLLSFETAKIYIADSV